LSAAKTQQLKFKLQWKKYFLSSTSGTLKSYIFGYTLVKYAYSNLSTEALAPKCGMTDTTQIYLSSDELEKLDILKLLMSDSQPVIIYGETGDHPSNYHKYSSDIQRII
jgi:hypothetical protein